MRRALLCCLLCFSSSVSAQPALELKKGDHICIIGNTLAERMQHHGWLETFLHARFPTHELVVRNLGFSGDEVVTRLRSAGFGSPDDHLRHSKADVVFAFFGYNESHAGPGGVESFKNALGEMVRHLRGTDYSGKGAPRVVLFSPIAHEDLRSPNYPDGSKNNANLVIYTAAISEVARANGAVFVDLFAPTLELYKQAPAPLTLNGIHLLERGDLAVARVIDGALFGKNLAVEPRSLQKLREAVLEKCFHWYQRYRTVDGYSIYGGRADLSFVDGQTNRVVMQRELEILDAMTANRDHLVWATAQGKPYRVDDSSTPEFIPVKTNLPGKGPNGAHLFLGGEEAISKMQLHPGMQVNLFASEEQFPELANPVQMAFDPRGRLWVAVMPSYPHWKPKEVMDDKVLIFEDTNQDGKADKMTVFADKLHVPTGLELWGGGLLLGQMPDLMFLKDTNGDDVADVRERVLHGLDSADTHHAMNSFTLDPGGALYFQEGTFHHTQVESPYGPPERCANAGVFRFEPRTSKFDVYVSYGFANPHGHVFDRWGQDFVTDGTGNVNYYATAFSGHLDFPRKHSGMEPFYNQRTRPCPGTEILSSRHFPDELQNNYLDANVIGFHGILQYRISEKDSGFSAVEVDPIIQSSDPSFRPVDLEMGPDGALYFVDWQNPIIGHMQHNLRDPSRDRTHGRVYRITMKDRPLSPLVKIAGEPLANLLEVLKEPEMRVRYRARIELSARPTDEVIAAVRKWIASISADDPHREERLLEALWLHQSHNRVDEELLSRLLRAETYQVRVAATRVLCYWRDRVKDPIGKLRGQANDPYPRVRLEAVRALSFFREPAAASAALEVLKYPMDYYLTYTLKETLTQLEPHWKKAVREDKTFAADNPAAVSYLLANVSTSDLLKMPRSAVVYQALLSRDQIVHDYRHEALEGLARLNGTSFLAELLSAIGRLDQSGSATAERVLSDLGHMFSMVSSSDLKKEQTALVKLSREARLPFTRQVATVARITADGSIDAAWTDAQASPARLRDFLEAVPLLPSAEIRATARGRLLPFVSGVPPELLARWKTGAGALGRFVRISLPRRGTLTLAEVEIQSGGKNVAREGKARQSSVAYGGNASRAIDGNRSGAFGEGGQTHTNENEDKPWWQVDLGKEQPVDSVTIWNRSEGGGEFVSRLEGFDLEILDAEQNPVFRKAGNPAPKESVTIEVSGGSGSSVRRSALRALVATGREEETFKALAGLVKSGDERAAAVKALSRIPQPMWPAAEARPLIDALAGFVRGLPAAERTQEEARDALQLGNDLAALLDTRQGSEVRKQLRELGVPVIIVRPVPNLMVYDRPQLYVEAGKPIEIVFENVDIMPHNLILARPKSLEKVGLEAERMAGDPNGFAKSFIPSLPEILQSTKLLQPGQSERLNFNAPDELGDYPFVCTFPGHWRRMNGVLHVVKSLDDIPPEALVAAAARPAGPVRPFVQAWTVADLKDQLAHVSHGRSREAGKKLFGELACTTCHRMNGGQGGQVGPDLIQVKQKLADKKTTPLDILVELVEPSRVIDEKFRPTTFVLTSGQILNGIITEENDQVVKLRSNPLEAKPGEPPAQDALSVEKSDIQERIRSEVSLMPAGLLNTLSEDEILDLLGFVLAGGD